MPIRALKVLVVVMGIMILAGFAIIVAVIAGRLSRGSAPAQAFTAPEIKLPAGARIEAMSVGTERLVIDIALPDGRRELTIIDLATGRRLGVVPLRAAP